MAGSSPVKTMQDLERSEGAWQTHGRDKKIAGMSLDEYKAKIERSRAAASAKRV